MMSGDDQTPRIIELEREVARLREEIKSLKSLQVPGSKKRAHEETSSPSSVQHEGYQPLSPIPPVERLTPAHIERYSRQLLLHEGFGVAGQHTLLSSSVLVIGAGGIGSTVLLYLAASGIGNISVVDFDAVERSNLHRQIIHKEKHVGMNKALSACLAMQDLNPSIACHPLDVMLTKDNALQIIGDHDCIVDASDNPRTRYLINDACVLAGKPLISGSAIGTEGQLSVLNWKKGEGPCYRCLYPKPSITAGAKSCSDNGVLGPVPGLIGVMQSLEVLKVLTQTGRSMSDRLLMYDALECSFLNIKKPKKQPNCPVCSSNATIMSMKDSDKDLKLARGPASCEITAPSGLDEKHQITCAEYSKIRKGESQSHVLLDVRVKEQFDLCTLDNAVNIPLEKLQDNFDRVETLSEGWTKPVFCVCRRGIASVEATKQLNDYFSSKNMGDNGVVAIQNITGGFDAWRKQVDTSFPQY